MRMRQPLRDRRDHDTVLRSNAIDTPQHVVADSLRGMDGGRWRYGLRTRLARSSGLDAGIHPPFEAERSSR